MPVPTHGVSVTRGADQLVLSYNRLTGAVVLEQLGPAGQTPTILAAEQWELNWSTVAPLRGWAESFVFCYEWRSGNYAIRALPATFGGASAPVWSSSGNVFPLVRQMTHALSLAHGTGVFIVGYWALTGMGSVYALRAGGRGLDFLARLKLDPGAPMMPSLGQGLAALDAIHVLPKGQATTDLRWFSVYSQTLGRALLYGTFGQ